MGLLLPLEGFGFWLAVGREGRGLVKASGILVRVASGERGGACAIVNICPEGGRCEVGKFKCCAVGCLEGRPCTVGCEFKSEKS